MRKSYRVFLIPAMMLALLTGCRGNVSNREDGKITEPTATVATMPTAATMPSTDTAPIGTMPSPSTESTGSTHATEATAESGMTDATASTDVPEQEGRARHARTRDPMERN